MIKNVETSCLLIGFGNTLRGDDGAGPRLAEKVAAWDLPQVRVLIRHALVPELAEDLRKTKRVLFVDACPKVERFEVLALNAASKPASHSANWGHFSDPEELLALAQVLHGLVPQAWLLLLPAVNFAMGEELSSTALAGIEAALIWIKNDWLAVTRSCPESEIRR